MEVNDKSKNNNLKVNINIRDGKYEVEGDPLYVIEVIDKLSKFGLSTENENAKKIEREDNSNLINEKSQNTNTNIRFNNNNDSKLKNHLDQRNTEDKFEKVKILVKQSPPWFTSKDIFDNYDGDISRSTVSMYLKRLVDQQILQRRGTKKDYEYKLVNLNIESLPIHKPFEKRKF